MSRKKVLKILYNESHPNKNSKGLVPQGGPARFANTFRNYFLKDKNFNLCPLLFTHEEGSRPYLKKTKVGKYIFNELVYERDLIRNTFKKNFTRKSFIKYIDPFIKQIEKLFVSEKPDLVFLNGFGHTNWMLMYVAKKYSVPVVIQHAGLWKKEIWRGRDAFSASMRKVFYDFERDTIRWCKHHIFLNNFSRDVFVDLYNSPHILKKSSVVPLPIDPPSKKSIVRMKEYRTGEGLLIGAVARWDSIKNHSAILRLASSRFLPKLWSVSTVTRIPYMSDFAKKYVKYVNIHPPVQPKELEKFYEDMDIIILPSNFDVSPTVAAESVLSGTPIVISDQVGWQDEFIKCGLSDHVVSTKISGKKLISVINKIMLERTKNKRKYALLQEFIKKNHNPSIVMNKYKQIFKLIVE